MASPGAPRTRGGRTPRTRGRAVPDSDDAPARPLRHRPRLRQPPLRLPDRDRLRAAAGRRAAAGAGGARRLARLPRRLDPTAAGHEPRRVDASCHPGTRSLRADRPARVPLPVRASRRDGQGLTSASSSPRPRAEIRRCCSSGVHRRAPAGRELRPGAAPAGQWHTMPLRRCACERW